MYIIPLSAVAVLAFAAIAAAQPAVVPAEESTTPAEESTTPAEESTAAAPNDTTTVEIRNNAFNPAELHVAPGSTVTFVNNDNVPHTATSDTKLFDLEIPPGVSY